MVESCVLHKDYYLNHGRKLEGLVYQQTFALENISEFYLPYQGMR
jgi:hypothetical protein